MNVNSQIDMDNLSQEELRQKRLLSQKKHQEKLLMKVKVCLEERESELNMVLDSWRGVSEVVLIQFVMEDLNVDEKRARKLLKQVRTAPSSSTQIVADIQSAISTIQDEPWKIIWKELIESYENFCTENIINPRTVPFNEKKDDIIYWFKDTYDKQYQISLQQAYNIIHLEMYDLSYMEYIQRIYNGHIHTGNIEQSKEKTCE